LTPKKISMSAPPPNEIASRLRGLAGARLPGLSQAADTAVKLCNAAQNAKSDQAEYNQLATNACELVYGIAERLRAKGQRNIDPKSKGDLDDLTGVLEKVLELAQANVARPEWEAFWYSDATDLKAFQEQLEQRIRSFTDLQYKADTRPQPKSDDRSLTDPQYKDDTRPHPRSNIRTNVNNSGTFNNSNLSHINQRGGGTVNQGNNYGQEMFGNASNFEIHGSEFNNVQRDMTKTSFSGKNVAPNFGLVGSQAFS